MNDVLFSATTGAVRRYCQARDHPLLPQGGADREGEDTGGLQMRALLPVSFPRKASITDTAAALRNLWCFVSCPMPVGSGGALGRSGRCAHTESLTAVQVQKQQCPLVATVAELGGQAGLSYETMKGVSSQTDRHSPSWIADYKE